MFEDKEDLRFRFRKIDNLFGRYQELERQAVYFASPHQQNDPMEGMIYLRWQGDAVLWKNFFMHYFRCMYLAYTQMLVGGNDTIIEAPIFVSSQSFPRMETSAEFRLAKAVFLGNCDLRKSARLLGRRTRETGANEVKLILHRIHQIVLCALARAFDKPDILEQFTVKQSVSLSQQIFETDRLAEEAQSFPRIEALHRKFNLAFDEFLFITAYNSAVEGEAIKSARYIITGGFPDLYLRSLRNIVHSECYAACFVRDYRNSSMWSHYAHNHTGVCLIYKTDKDDLGKRHLMLEGVTGYYGGIDGSGSRHGRAKFEFLDVVYSVGHKPVDFFSTLGRLPLPVIEKDWYTHGKARTSKEGLAEDKDEWRKLYWDGMQSSALTKTKDWAHEDESRLLLFGTLGYKSDEERLFTYEFRNLEGQIFGINTSEDDKFRISKIIEKKCASEKRALFDFYQAYFDPCSLGIEIEKLEFLKFDHSKQS